MTLIGPQHLRSGVPDEVGTGTHRLAREPLRMLVGAIRSTALLSTVRKLRPRKIRNAVGRRWFEWRMSAHTLADAPGLADLGSKPGGWTVPTDLIAPGWQCYCFGAGGDVSFDIALMQGWGAAVRSFEPVAAYVDAAREEVGPDMPFSAHLVALAATDGPISMQMTHHPGSESLSSDGLYEGRRHVWRNGRRLDTLMAELGDERVDLLKLDIEGAEYRVAPELDLAGAGVSLLSVQLHHNGGVRGARRLIDSVRAKGYELVACRPAVKLTFARRDLLASPAPVSRRLRGGRRRGAGASRTARLAEWRRICR